MELVYMALITTAGGLIGLLYLDKSFYRRLQWKREYEIEMLKLQKKEARTDKKLAARIKTKAPKGKLEGIADWIKIIKDLDPEMISGLLNILPDKTVEDIGEGDDLVSIISTFAQKNPDIVKGFIDGISSENIGEKNTPKAY